jgi:hypothetical protein
MWQLVSEVVGLDTALDLIVIPSHYKNGTNDVKPAGQDICHAGKGGLSS